MFDDDLWADTTDWLPDEHDCVLAIERPDGAVYRTRNVVDLAAELMISNPAAFARLALELAEYAANEDVPGVSN